jgi:nicotinamidase-related amidase
LELALDDKKEDKVPYKPGLLRREDCVLVLIDVQERLLKAIWEKERVADNALKLAKFAGLINMPVLVTEQDKLGQTIEPLREAVTGLEPIGKITFDCFGCDQFARRVEKLGRKTLLLAGIESHICVAQTAISGVQGHQVQVISDACSSRAAHNWLVALERLRQAGVVISSTEMVIYELLGQAGTEEFKATLPLVK